jgi:4-amino-4-deoxy-L-arabinose transferase-like glycosyltransferase
LLGAFAAVKLAIHLATNGPGAYGYFRDELYYLDCARHLGWGYVDQPPLSILILAATRALLGDGMLAVRAPAALIGAATVALSGMIAREMGGGRFAQALACLAVLAAPIFLAISSFFSMNAFDQFFWALAALILVRLIRTDDARLWLWFGLVAGLGLENKFSMGLLGIGVIVALAVTPLRRHFRRWELWAGGLIAAALFAPHVWWQIRQGWPTLEFMHNARVYKNMPVTALSFLAGQLVLVGPLNAPLWFAGLVWGLSTKSGRAFRPLSIVYAVTLAILIVSNGKVYYLSPAYPMLLAMGAVWLETASANRRWARGAALGAVIAGGLFTAPLAIPLLSPEALIRYQAAVGLTAPQQERAHSGALPQHLGDRLGWEEFVAMVAAAYRRLPPEDQARCSVLVGNYGETGAVNLLGRRYGLPRAISGHMTNYLWGPGDATGEVMLVYGRQREELAPLFASVEEAARFHHPYVMDRQNDRPLYLCRGLKTSVREAWPLVKEYQ